jgi:branched-chain amino acid transport system substrate-binding protein
VSAAGVPPAPKRSRVALVGGLVAGSVVLVLIIAGVAYALRPKPPGPTPPPTVAAACGYKIAYLGILSGADSADGQTIRNSSRMAVDRYVREHGNCATELLEYDTKGNSDEATRLADQLAKDPKVLGIVGPIWLDESQKVMPILDAAGITVVSPMLGSTQLARRGWKTFHRIIGNDVDQAAAGVRYLTTVLGAKRVFIVADNDEVGSAMASDVRLKLNTASAGRADIAGNETNYSAVISQIAAANADAVYFAGYHDAGAIFVKQLRTAKPGIKIVAWDRAFTGAFVKNAGKEAEGVVITCPCIPPTEARNSFASTYKDRYTEPGYYAPEAYDAATVLLAALAAGKSTRPDVLAYVNAYDGEGVSRRIKFTPNGDLVYAAPHIWAYQVRNGSVYKDQVMASD